MNKETLADALEMVRPGLGKKETSAQVTSFAFGGGGVMTYNEEFSISAPVPGLKITGAIVAEELWSLLQKVDGSEVDLSVESGEAVLTAGRARSGMPIQTEIKLPDTTPPPRSRWSAVPGASLDALAFVARGCLDDLSYPLLTCVEVSDDGQMTATDNHRVTVYRTKLSGHGGFLMPGRFAAEVRRVAPEQVTVSNSWVHFRKPGGPSISCRAIIGKLPEISKLMKVAGTDISLPANFADVMSRAMVFSDQGLGARSVVRVDVSKGKMVVRSRNMRGWFEEEARMRFDGKPFGFTADPAHLHDMALQCRACTVGPSSIRFAAGDWEHVTALVAQP